MSADGQSIKELHRGIIEGKTQEELDVLLWDAVLTYQDQMLYTLSGLEFSYTVKHKKNGEYSGGTSCFPQGNQQDTDKKLCIAGFS